QVLVEDLVLHDPSDLLDGGRVTGQDRIGEERLDEALGLDQRGGPGVGDRLTLTDAPTRGRGGEPHDEDRGDADERELDEWPEHDAPATRLRLAVAGDRGSAHRLADPVSRHRCHRPAGPRCRWSPWSSSRHRGRRQRRGWLSRHRYRT